MALSRAASFSTTIWMVLLCWETACRTAATSLDGSAVFVAGVAGGLAIASRYDIASLGTSVITKFGFEDLVSAMSSKA